ncbi:Xyloglucan galactosyltransferase KATAMARI1 [Triticum urartu]|uniref:Xyloglucan galactosyltransferase KATAMARI1 n=1 Tax=Triticum urartu TaxID=4572 RepID=M7YK11_TRIUA|nr:Xyloglucan galactosyltransferase KATAMARI1 [Triticum urartu]
MPNSLLLLLLVLRAVAGDAAADSADPCAGRRIHIRDLPPSFNTHLLRHCDAAFPLADPSWPNIRGSILAECANRTDACVVVDCSAGKCSHDPVRYMRPMLGAKFCLEPPGDTPTRRSTFDAILAGAVRRVLCVQKETVVLGGVKIAETLAAVPDAEVRRMRERALEMAPRVLYRRHGSTAELREAGNDAVDLAVDGALRRIRRRARALEEGQPERIYAQEDDSVDA